MSSSTSSILVPEPKFKNALKVELNPTSIRVKTDYIKVKLPEGMEMVVCYEAKNNRYSTMFILDHNNEVIQEFMGDPGKSAVVKVEESIIKVNPKDNTFTTKKKTTIYDKPGGKKIGDLDKSIKHAYESYYTNGEDDDDDETNYLNIKFGSKPSFFGKFNQKLADILYENRDKIKAISKLTKREILARLKDPIYFPLDKETKERLPLNEDNKANFWLKCFWYQHKGNFTSEFIVPTGDPEKPKILTRHELTGRIDPNQLSDPKYKIYGPTLHGTPTISFNEVYIKDEKDIYLQWRIQGAVISKIVPKSSTKIRKEQMEDLGKVSRAEINELEKQLRLLGEEDSGNSDDQKEEHTNGTMENVDMTDFITDASNNDDSVPGLPDLEN